jgi:hypothetical protein
MEERKEAKQLTLTGQKWKKKEGNEVVPRYIKSYPRSAMVYAE